MALITRTELPREGSRFAGRGPTTSRAFEDGSVISVTPEGIFEWEAATGLLRRTTWFLNGLMAQRISLSGDVFFLARTTLQVWRRATDAVEPLCEVAGPPPGSASWVVASPISVSADGTHVAFQREQQIEVLRCVDGVKVAAIDRPWSDGSFSLGHSGRWVLFARDESVQSGSGWSEYAVFSTSPVHRIQEGHLPGDDASVGFSNDGLAVEYSGRVEGNDLLDPKAKRSPHIDVDRDTKWPESAVPFAIDAVGRRALTWRGGSVIAIDLASRTVEPLALGELPALKLAALSADGKRFGCLPRDGQGEALQLDDPSARRPIVIPPKRYPTTLTLLPDGRWLMTSRNRIDRSDGTQLPLPNLEPAELSASHDGRVVAVRTGHWPEMKGPVLIIVDDAIEALPVRDTRETSARCLALRGDGALLAIATWNGIEIWGTSPAKYVQTVACAPAIALAFADEGPSLYALHADCTVSMLEP